MSDHGEDPLHSLQTLAFYILRCPTTAKTPYTPFRPWLFTYSDVRPRRRPLTLPSDPGFLHTQMSDHGEDPLHSLQTLAFYLLRCLTTAKTPYTPFRPWLFTYSDVRPQRRPLTLPSDPGFLLTQMSDHGEELEGDDDFEGYIIIIPSEEDGPVATRYDPPLEKALEPTLVHNVQAFTLHRTLGLLSSLLHCLTAITTTPASIERLGAFMYHSQSGDLQLI